MTICIICGADACQCGGSAPLAYAPAALEREKTIMAQWTADRRLYLDKNGIVVEADDPSRASLLINTGQTMTEADARRYGLINDDEPEGDEKARSRPANKLKTPGENKSAPQAESEEAAAAASSDEPEAPSVPRRGKDK